MPAGGETMRVVVTGALGHIGSRLIREMPSVFPDAEVVMLDNLATQRYPSLFDLPTYGEYRLIESDIRTCDLEPIFQGSDVVIHLAALTHAAESFRMKDEVEQVNVLGTERVAQACLKAQCPMVFASTTSVYGKTQGVVEEDSPVEDLHPQSPYADSKLKAEQCLQRLGEQEGLRFIICRLGTIFGVSPGMRFHTAVNKFCWQAILGQRLTVWRTALDQRRPYLELGDAVRAFEFILKKNLFDGLIYNVVTTHATVRDIIDILSSLLPDLLIEYVNSEIMNQLSYEVSNRRLVAQGFRFQGNLREGIEKIVQVLQPVLTRKESPGGVQGTAPKWA